MTESEIRALVAAEILAHERRVGFVSGVIGTVWLIVNIGVVFWVLVK
jgi:hypothetical protein